MNNVVVCRESELSYGSKANDRYTEPDLLRAEPKGEGIAHVEAREQHTVAYALGHAFLDPCVVGAVEMLSVACQLLLLRV